MYSTGHRWISALSYLCALSACANEGGPLFGTDRDAAAPVDARTAEGADAGPPPPRTWMLGCGEGASTVACAAEQECVGGACRARCEHARCGDEDAICCAEGERCVSGACVAPTTRCFDDEACPSGQHCDFVSGRCLVLGSEADHCVVPRERGFDFQLEWAWEGGNVDVSPLVVSLNDDNLDGAVDERDLPDVVVPAYAIHSGPYQTISDGRLPDPIVGGRLVALSGRDGSVLWETSSQHGACTFTSPAAADLDGDGAIEIVTQLAETGECFNQGTSTLPNNKLVASIDGATGEIEWISARFDDNDYAAQLSGSVEGVAISDLEGDGSAEIVINNAVFNADGSLRTRLAGAARGFGAYATFEDMDGDGVREIVNPRAVYRSDGTEIWRVPTLLYRSVNVPGQSVVGRFVADTTTPQVLTVRPFYIGDSNATRGYDTTIAVFDGATGTALVDPVAVDPLRYYVGGVAASDLDGDGLMDAVFTVGHGYGGAGVERLIAVSPAKEDPILWSITFDERLWLDMDPPYGVALFDFDADGSPEVVYQGACAVVIFAGDTGEELARLPGRSVAVLGYPAIADVDGDGSAELVVTSSGLRPTCGTDVPTGGVRVYGDRRGRWASTRRIWSEHGYVSERVSEAGRLRPSTPFASRAHTTRTNPVHPVAAAPAANLSVVSVDARAEGACPGPVVLSATVRNTGSRPGSANTLVLFVDVEHGLLGQAELGAVVAPGASIVVRTRVTDEAQTDDGMLRWQAIVDPAGADVSTRECDELDNVSPTTTTLCGNETP